jgi:hypothetical protein
LKFNVLCIEIGKGTKPNIFFESGKGGYIGVEHSFNNGTTAFGGVNVNDKLKPMGGNVGVEHSFNNGSTITGNITVDNKMNPNGASANIRIPM